MRHSNITDGANTTRGATVSNQTNSDSTSVSAVELDQMLDMHDLLSRLPFSRKIVLRMIHEQRIPAIYLNGKWGNFKNTIHQGDGSRLPYSNRSSEEIQMSRKQKATFDSPDWQRLFISVPPWYLPPARSTTGPRLRKRRPFP